ncbi:MAG: NAD(P)H-hydrate dehydratase [Endomicrobium sp.]|jgi:NAD(P)H-hydrate epimerase|nr:NAD(P)H-hydrate dehydratase [Endomicrobium sp.]
MKKHEIKKNIIKFIRKRDSYKYNYGHVLVIAGSEIMPGAGLLSCIGALYSGAGLVTYAVKNDFINSVLSVFKPEIMLYIYKTVDDIINFVKLRNVSSIVIGPGLICDNIVLKKFIDKILMSLSLPIILDASGLSCYNFKTEFKNIKAKLIITPHIGELSKLLNIPIKIIKKKKKKIISRYVNTNKIICVLKGKNTIVISNKKFYKNKTGTPAMAISGSGDILTGVIASFINIIKDPFDASKFAVFIHGLSGEYVEKNKGQIGVIASEIAESICYVMKDMLINCKKNNMI